MFYVSHKKTYQSSITKINIFFINKFVEESNMNTENLEQREHRRQRAKEKYAALSDDKEATWARSCEYQHNCWTQYEGQGLFQVQSESFTYFFLFCVGLTFRYFFLYCVGLTGHYVSVTNDHDKLFDLMSCTVSRK